MKQLVVRAQLLSNAIYSVPQLHTFDHALATPCSECLISPFLSQLTQEKVIYLKIKPFYSLLERSFETGIIFAMEGSRLVLVKVVLFQIRSTKTVLEPSMANILPVSKLLLKIGNRAFF